MGQFSFYLYYNNDTIDDYIIMATIKSYTDLEQSKKLAEILPLESADMWWNYYSVTTDFGTPQIIHLNTPWVGSFNWYNNPDNIPCWSLAALLELLPKRLEIVDNVCELSIYLYGLYYWNTINGDLCFEAQDKDNLVDACYELILKLNELNLL